MGEAPGIHALVVDDCLLDRKIVEKLLLKTGSFTVTKVDSGEKALDILGLNKDAQSPVNDYKIDIIVTDYCMPGMNGYDLLKTVKEHTHLKSIPVVIMSSENVQQRISSCRMIGAEDFILKPLHLRDIERLRNYIRPAVPITKVNTKRKLPLDMMTENNGPERRPRLAGVIVA